MASLCSASSALAILLCLPWLMGILLDGDGEDMMILIGMFGCMGCNCNSNFMIGLWRKKERVRGEKRKERPEDENGRTRAPCRKLERHKNPRVCGCRRRFPV
mmetsp:Transcript_3616/g.6632  ORF Transcript_3616/g.6632 Transcript_3616/m.6632 type:complete len:102 (-) Transcript_3616:1804-2109(-)